jgi:signal transduction histidine kinase
VGNRSRSIYFTYLVGIALAYYALGKLGLSLSVLRVTPVWPASGLAMAVLLLGGYRFWPAIWIGGLLVDFSNKFVLDHPVSSLLASIGSATGSTLAALLTAFLLNRYASGSRCLDRVRTTVPFLVGAALYGLVAASIGASSLYLGRVIPAVAYQRVWFTWWMGDLAGVLVVAPVVLSFYSDRRFSNSPWRFAEAAALAGLMLMIGILAFSVRTPAQYHIEYMFLPCLVYACFRFGLRGATLMIAMVSSIAIWGTIHQLGAFATGSPNESLLALQVFTDITAITTLLLSAVLAERMKHTQEMARAMNEAREARADAEEANRAKSVFLANMSHELRTPLNKIIGYSDLLREELDEEHHSDLIKIKDAGLRLLQMLSGILDLSMLETGKLVLNSVSFDVRSLVEQLTEDTRKAAEKKGTSLYMEVDDGLGEMRADQARIRQVLGSVLDNACKFTSNGSIRFRVSRDDHNGAERIRFVIADTGIGIPADQLERLFRPFFQADSSTTKNFEGAGLGLCVSKLVCDRMGGSIDVSSEPGRGSTFTILLPRSGAPASGAPASAGIMDRRL